MYCTSNFTSLLQIDTKRVKLWLKNAAIAMSVLVVTGWVASCKSSHHISGTHRGDGPGQSEAIHLPKANGVQKHVVEEAYTWLGTPYKYAGAEKGAGTDCSGMVMKVYESATGRKLPRNSAKQAEYCERIEADQVASGDLVFFATGSDASKVSHVGIIVSDEEFIHASSSRGVCVSKTFSPYYKKRLLMFGRVPEHDNLLSDQK